jgi:hypothetical protein
VGEDVQVRSAEQEAKKKSFWRFGGRYDSVFNWLCITFFVLSFVLHYRPDRIPEALGTAVGQTFWVVVILFAIFKVISH